MLLNLITYLGENNVTIKLVKGMYLTEKMDEDTFRKVIAAFVAAGAHEYNQDIIKGLTREATGWDTDDNTFWSTDCPSTYIEQGSFTQLITVDDVLGKKSAVDVAHDFYKDMVAIGWTPAQLVSNETDHDELAQYYLKGKNLTGYKKHQIRQIMQNIANNELEADIPPWVEEPIPEQQILINEEENQTMKKSTIVLEVTSKAFATVPAFDIIYGRKASDLSEEELFDALRRVDSEQNVLLDLGTEKGSTRITKQLNMLSDARANIIKAIDALPEEEE